MRLSEAIERRVQALAKAETEEIPALVWSFLYFFLLLAGYYVIRALRDEMGVAGGLDSLPWLFTATFMTMLVAVPLFGALVARFPRRRFLPFVYHFFAGNLLIFFVLFKLGVNPQWLARIFFVWVSVYNLFVISVFWSFMADTFSSAQGKRLFAFIAAGGSLGAIVGPGLTALLAVPLGPVNLFLVSVLFLEAAVFCIHRLLKTPQRSRDETEESAIGGSILAGARHVFESPYLLGICGYILLLTTTSTFIYFHQLNLVAETFSDPGERTRVFALIDHIVGILTVVIQLAVTGRLLSRYGLGIGLAALPALTFTGFLAFAFLPFLAAMVAFQSVRRATNFAISKPAREVLFTVITREDKYKSKNFIDTVVYRGGDAISGWFYAGLSILGLGLQGIALVGLPLAAIWVLLALQMGRAHGRAVSASRA